MHKNSQIIPQGGRERRRKGGKERERGGREGGREGRKEREGCSVEKRIKEGGRGDRRI